MTAPNNASGHKGWIEVAIDIHPVAREALGAFLFDLGCEGIVTGDFEEKTLKGYLPLGAGIEATRIQIHFFLNRLREIFPDIQTTEPVFRRLEEEDWNLSWRRFFRPMRITANLLVLPAWDPQPMGVDGQVLRIDPGPAFGTGQHPTTRMCLEAMEEIALSSPWTMLDVGTGSGILAIYGALLGANRIMAIDQDPEAVRWAEKNIALNHCSDVIELSGQSIQDLKKPFSLVTANLTLQTIQELMPRFSALVKRGGWLILSGILQEQKTQVQEILAPNGFEQDHELLEGEWACLVGRRL